MIRIYLDFWKTDYYIIFCAYCNCSIRSKILKILHLYEEPFPYIYGISWSRRIWTLFQIKMDRDPGPKDLFFYSGAQQDSIYKSQFEKILMRNNIWHLLCVHWNTNYLLVMNYRMLPSNQKTTQNRITFFWQSQSR